MRKIKGLLKKVAVSATLALPAMSVWAQIAPVTPGAPNINPVNTFTKSTLASTILGIVNYALGVVAIIAVAMILYAGYTYITAGMNEDATKKAKTTLLYGVIGIIVAALAFAIVSFATSFLNPNLSV